MAFTPLYQQNCDVFPEKFDPGLNGQKSLRFNTKPAEPLAKLLKDTKTNFTKSMDSEPELKEMQKTFYLLTIYTLAGSSVQNSITVPDEPLKAKHPRLAFTKSVNFYLSS